MFLFVFDFLVLMKQFDFEEAQVFKLLFLFIFWQRKNIIQFRYFPHKIKIVLSFWIKSLFNLANSSFLNLIASSCSLSDASFKPRLSLISKDHSLVFDIGIFDFVILHLLMIVQHLSFLIHHLSLEVFHFDFVIFHPSMIVQCLSFLVHHLNLRVFHFYF